MSADANGCVTDVPSQHKDRLALMQTANCDENHTGSPGVANVVASVAAVLAHAVVSAAVAPPPALSRAATAAAAATVDGGRVGCRVAPPVDDVGERTPR